MTEIQDRKRKALFLTTVFRYSRQRYLGIYLPERRGGSHQMDLTQRIKKGCRTTSRKISEDHEQIRKRIH